MNRRAATVVACVVAVAIGVGATWTLRRSSTTTERAVATSAGSTTGVGIAAPASKKRTRAETSVAAPETTPSRDDDKPKPVLLRFRVETEAGQPIAGAKIGVKWFVATPVELVTDENGAARMSEAVTTSNIDVVVRARGFVVESSYELTDDEAVVTLKPGVDVAGRVLDGPSGRPIAGASVDAFIGIQGPRLMSSSTTDAAGAFLLADVPADHEWTWLDVHAAGHVGAGFELDRDDSGPVVVRLDPAGRVRGVVLDAERRPVWDVHVIATPTQGVAGDTCPVGTTDMDGRFALDGLRFDADYDVRARVGETFATAAVVVTAAASEAMVALVAPRTPRATLNVVVGNAGNSPRDVRLLVCSVGEKDEQPSAIHATEATTVVDVEPGKVRVFAWADDRTAEAVDVELADGDTKRVEIALDRDLAVAGTVVDDVGAPVSGAVVECMGAIGRGFWDVREVTTNADGGFRVHVATPGDHRLRLTAEAHTRASVHCDAPTTEGAALHVTLSRRTTARLCMRTSGSPRQVLVQREWLDESGGLIERDTDGHASNDLDLTIEAPVTARRLRIRVDGFVPVVRDVRPAFGEPLDLDEITLDAGVGVTVRVVAADGTETSLDRDRRGTFAARLPTGRFRIVATRGDVSVEATELLVEGGTSDVTLRFAR